MIIKPKIIPKITQGAGLLHNKFCAYTIKEIQGHQQ